ncbi:MAG: methyltransferase domain-containing protein [Pseudomonadota bacterium]
MNPEALLIREHGREMVKVGGFILPAENFNLARFLRDDLGTTWLHAGGLPSTLHLVRKLDIRPGMRVLDLGCGVGSATRHLAKRSACHVTGVDADAEMLARARKATPAALADRIEYARMDVSRTGFADASFDRVVIQSVACFNKKPPLFREAARLLRPGGLLGMNEVAWLKPPTPEIEQVMCATICETFHGAELSRGWIAHLEAAGLVEAQAEEHPFTAATPYQILREEGLVNTLRIMWRVLSDPEINMRLSAMSEMFRKCPEYFSYGIYTARKPLVA